MAEMDIALVRRAEQALLGALLTGGDPAVVSEVHPADFSDPAHQAIYAALTGRYRRGGPAGWVQARLARLGGLRVARAAEYAEGLPACCPRRGHLLAYGAMILEARRQAAGVSGRESPGGDGPDRQLAGAGSWLSSVTRQRGGRGSARGAGQPAGDGERLAPATERLARVLAPVVARLRDEHAAQRGGGRAVAGPVLSKGVDGAGRQFTVEDLQDLVLAGLMRHPGGGRELVRRVPPEVFGDGARRDLYGVIRELIGRGLPVDALIAGWEAARRSQGGAREPAVMLALELGERQAAPGMAAWICRGLLADHVLTQAHGQDWTRQPLGGPPDAGQDAHRAAAAAPGPARSGQAAPRRQAGPAAQPRSLRPLPQHGGHGHGPVPRHG